MALTKETLEEISVENIMISIKAIVYRKIDPQEDVSSDLNKMVELYNNIDKDRIPVFTSSLHPRLIIHISTLLNYINNKKGTKADPSLKDLLDDNPNKYAFEKEEGFVVISKSTTVEEALNKMNKIKGCRDVFVTETGKEKDAVVGWLPNTLMARFLTTK